MGRCSSNHLPFGPLQSLASTDARISGGESGGQGTPGAGPREGLSLKCFPETQVTIDDTPTLNHSKALPGTTSHFSPAKGGPPNGTAGGPSGPVPGSGRTSQVPGTHCGCGYMRGPGLGLGGPRDHGRGVPGTRSGLEPSRGWGRKPDPASHGFPWL